MSEAVDLLNDEPIDVFINNAGIYGPRDANFGRVEGPAMAEVLYTNAVAPMLLTQLLIENVRKASGKKLVYISSKMGSIEDNGRGGSTIYRSSKTALNSVVKTLAIDLAPEGIAATALHPGWVRTDMGGPNGNIDAPESVSGMPPNCSTRSAAARATLPEPVISSVTMAFAVTYRTCALNNRDARGRTR